MIRQTEHGSIFISPIDFWVAHAEIVTVKASKLQMRREVIQRISALDNLGRHWQEQRLADRLPTLDGFAAAQVVLMHVAAFRDEVDTMPLLRVVLAAGKRLVCPRIDSVGRRLVLGEVRDLDRDLQPGYRGIREPAGSCRCIDPLDLDWALVPGLAFDSGGFRLGRGGGFYDRLLPTLRPNAACWALILQEQWVPAVPREPHDCPLTGVADHQVIRRGWRHLPVTGS